VSAFAAGFIAGAGANLVITHGESVTYTPRTGSARTIMAMIDRQPPDPEGGLGGGVVPKAMLTVCDRATAASADGTGGITAAELDLGGDKITYAERTGDTAVARRILAIDANHAGMLRVWVA
jgi:hypothetical protein